MHPGPESENIHVYDRRHRPDDDRFKVRLISHEIYIFEKSKSDTMKMEKGRKREIERKEERERERVSQREMDG